MSSQTPDIDAPRGTYVRLGSATRAALRRLADREQRTLSGEIRVAIDRHLESVDDGPSDDEGLGS